MKQEFNCVIKTKNPYVLQVGGIFVEIEYADQNKNFEDCMLNILKLKN